ncbi:transcriptional regulator, TetR family [Halogranum amylolyticum]|uniref:Transcriptional regulator, TetR family n=1 Tax=Halogranum amylolyticum TaxID=660520 RepID=A0A1H8U8X5_9EURY|nr:TetR/AcrR family transcriptional regulator [Halogranum amylolyticum]SEO99659.1 transcriptional regulator, TetR family [Halogranum amylolyticum]
MDDDPTTEILEATYRALCQHGYANLTVGDIAAEAERSKSLVHYYYGSKANLFSEFLRFLYNEYTTQLTSIEDEPPREQLFSILDIVLSDDETTPSQELRTAMLEVKVQAPYDDAIQARLRRFDDFLFERVQEIIIAGVDAGEFADDVNPTVAAEFFVTTITGAHTRRVAVGYPSERLYEPITRYVETHLLAAETTGDPR